MSPIKPDLLHELTEAAETLNRSSDDLTTAIRQFEEQINQTRVGVSVWLPDEFAEGETYIVGEDDGDNGRYERRRYDGWRLGFAKIGDAWRVVVRRELFQNEDGAVDARGQYEWSPYCVDFGPVALADAPRHVRVQAVGSGGRPERFERLLKALTERATEFTASVKAAMALVE